MPTYEYECKKCGHVFDVFQGITDPPVRSCPQCKGKVKRLLGTGSAVMFKGSGFYETDYKRKSTTASTGSSSEAGKKFDSGSSTSSSSTPSS